MLEMICSKCGTLGKPRSHTRGRIGIEIFLWFIFIIPGLIYSLWRATTRSDVCRACGSPELFPATSPVGKKVLAKHGMVQPRNAAVGMGRALGRCVRWMMGQR